MPLTDLKGVTHWPPPPWPLETVALQALVGLQITTGSPTNKAGLVIRPPRSGTVDFFGCVLAKQSLALLANVRWSFQGLNAAGLPDGVISAFRTIVNPTGLDNIGPKFWPPRQDVANPGLVMTSDGTDTGTKLTVTAGVPLACVIDCTAITQDILNVWRYAGADTSNRTYLCIDTGAGYVKSILSFPFGLFYTGVGYVPVETWAYPLDTTLIRTLNTGTTPDEYGNTITLPVDVQAVGGWTYLSLGVTIADRDYDLVLYDSGDAVKATISVLGSDRSDAAVALETIPFEPVDLAAGTYRIVVKPTTANSITMRNATLTSTTELAGFPGGTSIVATHRTNAGPWTDVETERAMVGLLLGSIEGVAPVPPLPGPADEVPGVQPEGVELAITAPQRQLAAQELHPVQDCLTKLGSRLHDQRVIWSEQELLDWYNDGYGQILSLSMGYRRFRAFPLPPRRTMSTTHDWEDRHAQGGTCAKVTTSYLRGYASFGQWEAEQAVTA